MATREDAERWKRLMKATPADYDEREAVDLYGNIEDDFRDRLMDALEREFHVSAATEGDTVVVMDEKLGLEWRLTWDVS